MTYSCQVKVKRCHNEHSTESFTEKIGGRNEGPKARGGQRHWFRSTWAVRFPATFSFKAVTKFQLNIIHIHVVYTQFMDKMIYLHLL